MLETCEAVTVIETPPMIVIGVVGYIRTAQGLRSVNTVWAEHLSEEVKRRFYKNWRAPRLRARPRPARRARPWPTLKPAHARKRTPASLLACVARRSR
jgi:ribosomal protein L3